MLKLPSERLYISNDALLAALPGVKKINARLSGARLGHLPHAYLWSSIDYNNEITIYADRRFDDQLAKEFQTLQNRLVAIGRSGKLRLNLVSLTLLAFAIRCARDADRPARFDLKAFEAALENSRRRLVRSTTNKHGTTFYQDFRARWAPFMHWIHYNLLYENDGHKRPPYPFSAPAHFHRGQLEEVASWITDLLAERCESQLTDEVRHQLALRVKRHARRRRFEGCTLREILANKARFQDAVFEYVRRHASVTVKFKYLDLTIQQSTPAQKIFAAMVVHTDEDRTESPAKCETVAQSTAVSRASTPGSGVLRPTPSAEPASRLALPATVTQPRPATERVGSSDEELIQGVANFLRNVAGFRDRQLIATETIRQAPASRPKPYSGSRLPFAVMVASAKPPEPLYDGLVIDFKGDQLYWEIDWLLENLSRYVQTAEIPEIIRRGWTEASLWS